jgi:hypothetical protein
MADISVRAVLSGCLGKSGSLSVLRDVFGVYANDHPQTRSLKSQLDLISHKPYLKLGLVTINGASPIVQGFLDAANNIYQRDVGCWIYCVGSVTVDRPDLLAPDQDNCSWPPNHTVSHDEDELFNLGRNLGASIIGYFIQIGPGGFIGCAAHPQDRRGFWVSDGATYDANVLAHELTHDVGQNHHVPDNTNLMYPTALNNHSAWLGKTIDENNNHVDQCQNIKNDPAIIRCNNP